jgi:uncharacterized protein YcfJ
MQSKSLLPNHCLLALMATIVLSACVSAPTGPTITIMPREGKSFEEFKKDDDECRAFAAKSVQDGNTAALKEGAISTATGAAIGAAAGALYQGGSSKNVGTGAAIGMVGGAAVGAMGASSKETQAQTQYNTAYQQCMYTKGNQVPGFKPVNDYKLIK